MRPLAILAAALALAACQREEPVAPAPAAIAAQAPSAPAPAPEAQTVEGWRTDIGAYALNGQTAPAFSAKLHDGKAVTQQALRGHWTILVFWGLWSDDSLSDARYIRALFTAADQDPDLDILTVHTPPGPGRGAEALGAFRSLDSWFADQGGPWATVMDDDGKIAEAYKVAAAPIYLLVGPDLTIEGWRTELSATPEEGIKSAIRGVAAIKKQIAAPQ